VRHRATDRGELPHHVGVVLLRRGSACAERRVLAGVVELDQDVSSGLELARALGVELAEGVCVVLLAADYLRERVDDHDPALIAEERVDLGDEGFVRPRGC